MKLVNISFVIITELYTNDANDMLGYPKNYRQISVRVQLLAEVLAVLGCNPAIIESSPQNFPGSAEYFLGSVLTHKSDADVESGE